MPTSPSRATICNHAEVIKVLLADKRVDVNCQTEDQTTPLHVASSQNSVAVVTVFLSDARTNMNVQDDTKRTPLHYASNLNHLEFTQALVALHRQDMLMVRHRCCWPRSPRSLSVFVWR